MPVDQEHHDRRWWTLGAVCVATFMLLLDITIVNVALPDIEKSLHSSFTDLQATGVDWGGLITFSLGLFLLVFALVRGNAEGWGSAIIVGPLIGAAALLVAFVVVERRQARPMFDLTLFRKRAFAGVSIAAFCLSASMFSMFLYLTLYIQNSLGYSPLQAGPPFLPVPLLSFVVAPIAGKLSARLPVRALMGAGLTLVGVGLLLMRGLDPSSGWTAVLPGFILAGAGIGMTNPPLASTA